MQVSLALERQLSGQMANSNAPSLINLPVTSQVSSIPALSTLPSSINIPVASQVYSVSANTLPMFPVTFTQQHPPLTASNSVANCNSASQQTVSIRELDSVASNPVDRSQQMLRPSSRSNGLYKTALCRGYEERGTCRYGDRCQFAHGVGELRALPRHHRYKTKPCRSFLNTGICSYGPRCHFIHNNEDSKCHNTLHGSNGMPGSSNPNLCLSSLSPPHMSRKDYDIWGFSLGSAGELSPTSSISSSGSPTLDGFFIDGVHSSYSQVPRMVPPTLTSGEVFSLHHVHIKPLSALPSLVPKEDWVSSTRMQE